MPWAAQSAGTKNEAGSGTRSQEGLDSNKYLPLMACVPLTVSLHLWAFESAVKIGKSPYLPHRGVSGIKEKHTSCSAQCLAHSEGLEKC